MSTPRFPGETPDYRKARDELLQAEIDLRRQVERVAELRRALPPGGLAPEDYVFEGAQGPVRLSELFLPGQDTLVVYSFMFGPAMADACPSCTAFLDSLDGAAPHIEQQVGLAVVAKSPYQRVKEYADGRGWRNFRLFSSGGTEFNRDYHAEYGDGDQMTIMHVFTRDADGRARHFYSTELSYAPSDPGQNPRHIDMMWPLRNVLDLTPGGRGKDWQPKREYA